MPEMSIVRGLVSPALVALAGLVALVSAAVTPAAEGQACKPPSWAPQAPAGYHIESCETKAWTELEVELSGGSKKVDGSATSVNYQLAEGAKDHGADEMRRYYIAVGKKAGATLKTADEGYNATLQRQTSAGEEWLVYEHGAGNEDSTGSFTLTTLHVEPLRQEVVAQPLSAPLSGQPRCADPPWLKQQFSYFKLSSCGYRDLDQVALDLADGQKKVLAGRYFETTYELTDESRDPTALAVRKSYVTALQAIGARLVSSPDDGYRAVLTQKTPLGDLWYIYEHGSGNESSTRSYSLLTVEVGGPPPTACTLEVYGISFDFNKATLRPDSEPVLQQLKSLFASDPSFHAEVGGHTDNVGKQDYNLKLSRERAEAVKGWLVAHGIDAGRITTGGYGDTRPLVPNTSDQNRFKNRRVELRRSSCKS
jgi:outer membrane protein OmpA-like peptidoglycan-associated protein